jgi:Mn-dependent DtxR family transcriptional regulator
MNAEQARSLRDHHELLKRLSKYLALYSFRNTHLEALHFRHFAGQQDRRFF